VSAVPVARDTVVSLKVAMYDAHGSLIKASGEPLSYLHGGYGGMLEALESALEGRLQGESVQAQLEPEQAFGEYDAELLRVEPAERYGQGLQIGMQVEEDRHLYTVTDVAGGKAVLDANHPLAGMALRFHMEITDVRPASREEIARGASLT
jgi:FKBP-type peptidyl-prolyl cis-trans isomerase SlyD